MCLRYLIEYDNKFISYNQYKSTICNLRWVQQIKIVPWALLFRQDHQFQNILLVKIQTFLQ